MKLSISESAFFSSIRAGDASAVEQALRPEPYLVDFQDEIGKTPLVLAIENGLPKMVRLLIAHGAKLDMQDADGNSPLHLAVEKYLTSHEGIRDNFVEIADILLNSGIDVNIVNEEGFSCLHNASVSGDKEMVLFLVKKGANVNLRNHKGYTPLLWGLCANVWERDIQKHLDTLDTLIDNGADINSKTDDGKNSLIIAREKNTRSQFIEFLQKSGAK